MLGANPHGYQLWIAMGVLHGLNRVFRCKSPHHQGQLAVGCRLDGKPVDPQHVLRGMRAAAVHFHNELDVFHCPFLLAAKTNLDPLGFGVGKIPRGSTVMTQTSPQSTQSGESVFR
jgi:hypothetical protein